MKDLLLCANVTLSLKPYIWEFRDVIWQTTSKMFLKCVPHDYFPSAHHPNLKTSLSKLDVSSRRLYDRFRKESLVFMSKSLKDRGGLFNFFSA